MQKLLKAQLLTIVLIEHSEHEVGGCQAVVEIREQVCELFNVEAPGEVIQEAFIHLLNLLGVMLGVLGQPENVRLGESEEQSLLFSFYFYLTLKSYLDLKAAHPILVKPLVHLEVLLNLVNVMIFLVTTTQSY